MKLTCYLTLFLLLAISAPSFCQNSDKEYFITLNGNLYLPVQNPDKGVFPILWYDKETDPKLLIGGMGAGFTIFKPTTIRNLKLKGQANLSRYTYWDEPMILIDENNNPREPFLASSSDFTIGATGTAHYAFAEKFSVGTGLGAQVMLFSLSRLPETEHSDKSIRRNRHYKPLVPILPLELSYKAQATLFNLRYEHGLINRIRGDLKNYRTDNYGLLIFEIGVRM
ncbi:hypothetical protein FVR03_10725 [Pontibacter qinzhouensis]|uniref:Porin family protein n=1 Tax=Pontibacter qinzhouensis TaxID=2603253 RepID=A0A5C8KAN3_9BACT|nr:hypothetical protein [Pontibacter qinzhouensis]TXK46464.1 hypothetical protein FVR03_10725 [Pontibacter qinzhouensis]